METTLTIPVIIMSMAILSFAIRFLPLSFLSSFKLPGVVDMWLRNIAIGMLSAMLFQSLFLKEGYLSLTLGIPLLAALISLVVALLTKNILATVVAGVAVVYIGTILF